MKLDILAGITGSVAFHLGAAVVVCEFHSRLPGSAPAAVQVVEEVVLVFSGGDELNFTEGAPSAEQARLQDDLEIAAAPLEKAEHAPPFPMPEEKPRLIGPAQVASTEVKLAPQTPAREGSTRLRSHPGVKARNSEPRGSTGGTTTANYRSRASLSYPSSALRDRAGGRVVLLVNLDESGRAVGVTVRKSSGRIDLDAAAIACARQSSYEPYRVNGVAKATRVEAPFEFKIPANGTRH